jgi:glycosyltransferase involved in cell wall biosynthesis
MTTIHQFSPVMTQGDGVSGSVFYIQVLLESLGYESGIYAWKSTDELTGHVLPLSRFEDHDCDVLLVHHSMGHEQEEWLRSTNCRKIVVYHNITPSHYFQPGSDEEFYSERGREQLRAWRPLFSSAICVSPFNAADLEEAGYQDTAVIPLLIDMQRFEGDIEPPRVNWRPPENEILIVSVGRIAENKRQHLLLEALWHLKKMLPEHPVRLILVGGTTSPGYHHQLLARVIELGLEHSVTLSGKCSDAELRWLYKNASLMWCASEHEGFCIPLIEANYFSLPVVSFVSSNIPDTLGRSGLLVTEAEPITMAAASARLMEDTMLCELILKAGSENLQRYTTDTLLPQLNTYLEQRGITP